MCHWRRVAGQGVRSVLPKHGSDEKALDTLGGMISESTESQKKKKTAAPIVPNIK
jgi:hypothetical protein